MLLALRLRCQRTALALRHPTETAKLTRRSGQPGNLRRHATAGGRGCVEAPAAACLPRSAVACGGGHAGQHPHGRIDAASVTHHAAGGTWRLPPSAGGRGRRPSGSGSFSGHPGRRGPRRLRHSGRWQPRPRSLRAQATQHSAAQECAGRARSLSSRRRRSSGLAACCRQLPLRRAGVAGWLWVRLLGATRPHPRLARAPLIWQRWRQRALEAAGGGVLGGVGLLTAG